jgi:hypothetical protein
MLGNDIGLPESQRYCHGCAEAMNTAVGRSVGRRRFRLRDCDHDRRRSLPRPAINAPERSSPSAR